MPTTINREWVYPNKGKKPYFTEISQMYAQIDIDVNTLFNRTLKDITPAMSKGSLITDNGTSTIILPVGLPGYHLSSNPSIPSGLEWVAPVSGGAGLFTLGSGTLSAYRTGTTNTTAGNYSFAVGQGNTVAISHSISCGQNNNNLYGENDLVCGSSNTINYSSCSVIAGDQNGNSSLSLTNSIICGYQNNRTSGQIYNSLVSGYTNEIVGDYNIVGGRSNSGIIIEAIISGYNNILVGSVNTRSIFIGQNNTNDDVSCSFNSGDHCYSKAVKDSVITGKFNFVKNSTGSTISGENNCLIPGNIGTTISLSSPSGGIVTLTDSTAKFLSGLNGVSIVISGATNPTNNGTFTATYISSTQISFSNASGVAESSNSSLVWTVNTSSLQNNIILSGFNNYVYNGGDNSVISGEKNFIRDGLSCLIVGSENYLLDPLYAIVGGANNSMTNGAGANSLLVGTGNFMQNSSISSIICGSSNIATYGTSSSIFCGVSNLAMSCANILVAGTKNTVSGNNNITLGILSYNQSHNAIFSSGGHPKLVASTTYGQGQVFSHLCHSGYTSNGSSTRLYTLPNNTGIHFPINNNIAMVIVTYIIAKCAAGGSAGGVKSWKLETTINNASGTITIIGTTIKTVLQTTSVANEASWDIDPVIYSSSFLGFDAVGHASDTDIRWQCFTSGAQIGITD